jgi:excisionase family DNA binding protein
MSLLLTYAEAAESLGVSPATLRRLVADGELPAVSVRGAVRVARSDVERYVERLRTRRMPDGIERKSPVP